MAAPVTEPLLRCDHLTMRFGGLVAIADLDLAVAEHSIHSIIGPNGAGKTTVFNCITQNLRPSGGEVWFAGAPAVSSESSPASTKRGRR